ncbi:MAG: glycosyltransferase [Armatimonadetes bacterium]|nr:glycosyltransferase [Armatimonadota bacterium]
MKSLLLEQEIVAPSLTASRERVQVDGKFFRRGEERFRIEGVTYGPFAPDAEGHQFPAPDVVRRDFQRMRQIGVNTIRTYFLPPHWFLSLAEEEGMQILVDVPWPKHLCFLDRPDAQQEARRLVRHAASVGKNYSSLFAYSIGNEIPSDIARWHGAKKVERFISELYDVARQEDPHGLITYANYPSTEYLDLSFLDFLTFNVYLHDREAFTRYLYRLQHIAGEKPLVLGEIGMDTMRHGEEEQAEFIGGHLREARLLGLAGTFVFAWTDDWYTGGFQIEDWAFGITDRERNPKPSFHAVGDVYGRSPSALLNETPKVSVVVCSYNGGPTLDQCLDSLMKIDYPNYEVILVDDGSTDNTKEIVARYPEVRAIHQENQGLSAARNVGLYASTGEIVAYTDSDCFADPDWLAHMVYPFQRTDAAAVGGPNLTPEDGWVAACIAASPGQPTHVMENDQVAEHIPGCNMAFRREALESINGFDPAYWKAGDDVDVCWRLRHAGGWIGFAPGAFVWHHRRQNPRTYIKQQKGYGEAEALLRFKHPDQFNHRGDGKWRGFIYGAFLRGVQVEEPMVYRGTFGAGLFQCVYRPGSPHWLLLPGSLEWHGVMAAVGLTALVWSPAWLAAAAMLGLSAGVAVMQAAQARLEPRYESWRSRMMVARLCYLQPLARSWERYATRLRSFHPPHSQPVIIEGDARRLPLSGTYTVDYWSEEWRDRTEFLQEVVEFLNEHRWTKTVDTGWTNWDLEVFFHYWTALQVRTVQEDHGSGKRLIRVQYKLRLTRLAKLVGQVGGVAALVAVMFHSLPAALVGGAMTGMVMGAWLHGTNTASKVVKVFDGIARRMRFIRCTDPEAESEGPESSPGEMSGASMSDPPEEMSGASISDSPRDKVESGGN